MEDTLLSNPLTSGVHPNSDGRDLENDQKLSVCRICLAMDKKLFPIRKYKLDQAYENLTGARVSEKDKLPQKLCYECVQRLINCSRFRTKSLRAMTLMMQIVKNQDHLTINSIKSISRMNNQLASTLAPKHFATNHYDYLLEDESSKKKEAVQEIKIEIIEEFNSVKDTEDNLNGSMYSSDDSLDLGVGERKKIKDNSKRVTRMLYKEKKSEIVKSEECLKTFEDHDEYDRHLGSHEEHLDEDLKTDAEYEIYAPKYRETDNAISDIEIKYDKEPEDSNLDIKHEDPLNDENAASEKDNTTDDSAVSEVKKRKIETVQVEESPQKNDTEAKRIRAGKEDATEPKTIRARKKDATEPKTIRARKEDATEPKRKRPGKPSICIKETLFDITELTVTAALAENEKRRESSNYKNALYRCEECCRGYVDFKAYDTHMIKHTNESGEHRCPVCKIHFKRPLDLRKHVKEQHSHRYSCKQCPYVTTHKQLARLHEKWHDGTKYSCPHCPEVFLKFTTYMSHRRLKHPSDFVCQLCGFSFVSEKGIVQHKNLKHKTENATIPSDGPHCELCDIRFVNSEALERHVSVSPRHHNGDKAKMKPNTLIHRKKTKQNIKEAMDRLGQGEINPDGPIPCEQCGVQLEDSRAYHYHFRRMHPDKNRTNYPTMKTPCMCEVCGKIFQSYASLKDHQLSHTDEKQFKCEFCDKSFSTKLRIKEHLLVHRVEKVTFPCSECGKHFSTRSNRLRHMIVHTGLKPYNCEICGKGFKQKVEKQSHISYVHLKKPWQKRSRKRDRKVQTPTPDLPM